MLFHLLVLLVLMFMLVSLLFFSRQSYDVDIELEIEGTGIKSRNNLDLKNPFFRYTGTPPAPPAGSNTASPTEVFWAMGTANDANGPAVGVVSGNHMGGGMLNSVGGMGMNTVYSTGNLATKGVCVKHW